MGKQTPKRWRIIVKKQFAVLYAIKKCCEPNGLQLVNFYSKLQIEKKSLRELRVVAGAVRYRRLRAARPQRGQLATTKRRTAAMRPAASATRCGTAARFVCVERAREYSCKRRRLRTWSIQARA